MNNVQLIGRLTRDPDQRYSGSENDALCISKFTLAVDRKKLNDNGQREADFISCIAFGKIAESIGKYFNKGNKIGLTGHIQTGSYTDRDGKKVYTTDVIVDSWEFAESANGQQSSNSAPNAHPAQQTTQTNQGFMDIPDDIDSDALPFG